jgi:antitoxin component of MazEF toxin-antitoxin module
MSDHIIASLVPARVSPNARSTNTAPGTFAPTSLPLTELLPLPRRGLLQYNLSRVDVSGRISARSLLGPLGWQAGQALQLSVVKNAVVMHPDPAGPYLVPDAPVIVLPASIRKRCGYQPGEQVLLVVDPTCGVLVVHPLSALDSMVATYHSSLLGRSES